MKSTNFRLVSLEKNFVELRKFRPGLFRAPSLFTMRQKLGPRLGFFHSFPKTSFLIILFLTNNNKIKSIINEKANLLLKVFNGLNVFNFHTSGFKLTHEKCYL